MFVFLFSGGSESVNTFSKDLRRIPVFKDDGFEDLVNVIAVEDIRQGLILILSSLVTIFLNATDLSLSFFFWWLNCL